MLASPNHRPTGFYHDTYVAILISLARLERLRKQSDRVNPLGNRETPRCERSCERKLDKEITHDWITGRPRALSNVTQAGSLVE